MAASELGPWEPLALAETVALFAPAPFRWWISGGLALELHLGRSWRGHDDTDVGIRRRDVPLLPGVLRDWDIRVGVSGVLEPWDGGPLAAGGEQNNLWCRRSPDGPWRLDVTVGEGDDDEWIYRRDERVRMPWSDAVLATADRIPYLAPDLQLLFKSARPRPKDEVDAQEVIPALDVERRERLARLLPPDHAWQRLVG